MNNNSSFQSRRFNDNQFRNRTLEDREYRDRRLSNLINTPVEVDLNDYADAAIRDRRAKGKQREQQRANRRENNWD